MIKKISILVILLLILGGSVIYFFGSALLNKGIKVGIESLGPQITQTAVTLDAVNVSLLSGKGMLQSLTVANPSDFKNEHIFTLGRVDIDIDMSSLLGDSFVINKIHIRQPQISYEKNLTGSNLKALQQSIAAFSGAEAADDRRDVATDGTPSKTSKRVLIKKLIIEEGTIYVGFLGAGAQTPLPRIEMDDIGADDTEQSIDQIIALILTEVIQVIGPALASSGEFLQESGQTVLETLESTLLKGADAGTREVLNKASEQLKNLLGQ